MRSPRVVLAASLLAALAVACTESTEPNQTVDVLAGLTETAPQDSAGAPMTPPPGGAGAGYFRGYVRGPNAPGTDGDTLATSPRIGGVVVHAYPITGYSAGGTPLLGTLAGEVTTNAQGEFTFPTIPGGEYVVTFRPPAGSAYQGMWVTGPIHPTSHTHPWWVTLPRT